MGWELSSFLLVCGRNWLIPTCLWKKPPFFKIYKKFVNLKSEMYLWTICKGQILGYITMVLNWILIVNISIVLCPIQRKLLKFLTFAAVNVSFYLLFSYLFQIMKNSSINPPHNFKGQISTLMGQIRFIYNWQSLTINYRTFFLS